MSSIFSKYQRNHGQSRPTAMAQARVLSVVFFSLILSVSFSTTNVRASTPSESLQPHETIALERAGGALSQTFIHMAQQAKPSVVLITAKKKISSDPRQYTRAPFLNIPFFKRFFGHNSRPEDEIPLPDRRELEMASGVIIRSDGYILTNQHVIEQAYDIRIQLTDAQIFQAELIGQDQATDLAVLKIHASQLPAFRWGNSDLVKVGEIVMAVGNPFGLSQTVSGGLISATGQGHLGFVDYESFIQTDAAINPGNSGGALLNLNGELIGINTALLAESSGALGIGFAIPSQIAQAVAASLIKEGHVTRGWLGIATQTLTPELATQFKGSTGQGVVITDLAKDGPAGRAKLQRRDIILEYQKTPITNPRQLQSLIAETPPGTSITIRRLQGGQDKTINVTIETFPLEPKPRTPQEPANDTGLLTGVTIEALPKDFPLGKEGVLVSEITPGSLADKQGLEEGDIILDINQTAIRSAKEFEQTAKQLERLNSALLLLRRENATMFLPIHKGK
jgi:serine protease Do